MVKKMTINNHKGTSLVETMVVLLIFSFITAGLYAASLVGENSWVINNARIQMQKELRTARDRIKNDLQQANSTSITNTELSGFDRDSINFYLPNPGTTSGYNSDQDISYQLSNDQLHRVLADGSDASNNRNDLIAQNIQSLNFDDSSGPVLVTITAQNTTEKGQDVSYTVEFEVNPRN